MDTETKREETKRTKLVIQWGGYNLKKREIRKLVLPSKKSAVRSNFLRLEIIIRGSNVPIVMYDLDEGSYYNHYKGSVKDIKRRLEHLLNITSIRPYWNRNMWVCRVVVPGDIIVVWGNHVREILGGKMSPEELEKILNTIEQTLDSRLFL